MERDGFRHGFPESAWRSAIEEAKSAIRKRARRKRTLSYSELVSEIASVSLDPHDPRLSHLLGIVAREEHEAGRGMLTVLVVHKGGTSPGRGFFEMARQLGYQFKNEEAFWIEQFNLVCEANKDAG